MHMPNNSALETIFTSNKLGAVISHKLRDMDMRAYRVETTAGLFALVAITKPFKIGGGIHTMIILPQAETIIGPAALYVERSHQGRQTLPKIQMESTYWAIFKAIQPKPEAPRQHPKPIFKKFQNGKVIESWVEYNEAGVVTAVRESSPYHSARKSFATFYSADSEPEHHTAT